LHALPAGPSRRGGHRRGDRRPAIGGVRRGREPAARAEGDFDLVPGGRQRVGQTRSAKPGAVEVSKFHLPCLYSGAMTNPDVDIPVREPAQTGSNDTILPFAVKALDLRGRIVRLGAAVDTILTGHDYPTPVAKLLGEAIVLTVMLGSALKFGGRFILQTQSDGPVRMLVVDFISPGNVRACARFDANRVAAAIAANEAEPGKLLGHGHLAMTIDQGPEMSRYQGLVPLEGGDLERAAHEYFSRSEQIPTRVRLAIAEEYRAGEKGARRHWRAGGNLLQFPPKSFERARQAALDPGDAPPGTAPHALPEDDAWVEGRSLVATVDDVELIDP